MGEILLAALLWCIAVWLSPDTAVTPREHN